MTNVCRDVRTRLLVLQLYIQFVFSIVTEIGGLFWWMQTPCRCFKSLSGYNPICVNTVGEMDPRHGDCHSKCSMWSIQICVFIYQVAIAVR